MLVNGRTMVILIYIMTLAYGVVAKKVISFKMSDEEMQILDNVSEKTGLDRSKALRSLILETKSEIKPENVGKMMEQLKKEGMLTKKEADEMISRISKDKNDDKSTAMELMMHFKHCENKNCVCYEEKNKMQVDAWIRGFNKGVGIGGFDKRVRLKE